MNDEDSIRIEGFPLTAMARRSDRYWGHALDVRLVGTDGAVRGQMVFACHPEFPGFDECQAMGTEELVDLVRLRVEAALAESFSAFELGLTVHFRINSPTDEFDPAAAGS